MRNVKEMLSYHFPQDKVDDDTPERTLVREAECILDDYDPPITIREVEKAFRVLNKGKAPGLEGLFLRVVKILFTHNKPLFLEIMNKCLEKACFPQSWNSGQLVLFNKWGKNATDP